jgi:hypothetical protein
MPEKVRKMTEIPRHKTNLGPRSGKCHKGLNFNVFAKCATKNDTDFVYI